jgi:UDP-N-acetylglucosamine acyltransferase
MDGNNGRERLMKIHETSIIHPDAKIHSTVEIGPFCIIDENVIIDNNTYIYSNVHIMKNSIIGKNNIIHQGTIVGGLPQDLKFQGEDTKVVIGHNNVIREYVTINRGTGKNGVTSIGDNNLLMAYVHLAHDCIIDSKIILANAVQLAGHVTVGFHATIGGITGVHQFCKIGEHSFVGACRVVLQDVPPFILATGEPLKYSGINSVGLRRRGFDNNLRNVIKSIFNIIYLSNNNTSQAIIAIKRKIRENSIKKSKEIKSILDFIENSERGII